MAWALPPSCTRVNVSLGVVISGSGMTPPPYMHKHTPHRAKGHSPTSLGLSRGQFSVHPKVEQSLIQALPLLPCSPSHLSPHSRVLGFPIQPQPPPPRGREVGGVPFPYRARKMLLRHGSHPGHPWGPPANGTAPAPAPQVPVWGHPPQLAPPRGVWAGAHLARHCGEESQVSPQGREVGGRAPGGCVSTRLLLQHLGSRGTRGRAGVGLQAGEETWKEGGGRELGHVGVHPLGQAAVWGCPPVCPGKSGRGTAPRGWQPQAGDMGAEALPSTDL